jgi:phosphate starvation-inducible protein PhoH
LENKPSKKQKRTKRQNDNLDKNPTPKIQNFKLEKIAPKTNNQKLTFDNYSSGKNLLLIGTAGTGKTFLSLYLGVKDVMDLKYKKMIIVRSVVPTRDMGFLPGNQTEKSKVYEAPYYTVFSELFNRSDAYDILKNKHTVQFITTSFTRGITLNDCVIVIDEIQNMVASELHTIITRIGNNCKVIFSGDLKQTDLNKRKEMSGFSDFIKILKNMGDFSCIEFDKNDIVRSDIVKKYIITREFLEDAGQIDRI